MEISYWKKVIKKSTREEHSQCACCGHIVTENFDHREIPVEFRTCPGCGSTMVHLSSYLLLLTKLRG